MVGSEINSHSVHLDVQEKIKHGISTNLLNSIIGMRSLEHKFIDDRKEFSGFKFAKIIGIETNLNFGAVVEHFALPIKRSTGNHSRQRQKAFVLGYFLILSCRSQVKFSITN